MLNLPKIPYRMEKNKSQIVAMRGINFSNMIADGDMVDSKNISARAYPYITTRKSREGLSDEYAGATATTMFKDRLVYVKGNDLYWGDKHWANSVSVGAKQFAVINTKLVIMPDKIYIDGESGELGYMGVRSHIHADFTANTIVAGEGESVWFDSYNAYVEGNRLMLPRRVHISNDTNISMRWRSISREMYTQTVTPEFRERIPINNDGTLFVTNTSGEGYLELSARDIATIASSIPIGEQMILRDSSSNAEYKVTIVSIEREKIYVKKIPVTVPIGMKRTILHVEKDISESVLATIKTGEITAGYMRSKIEMDDVAEIREFPMYTSNNSSLKVTTVTNYGVNHNWMYCYFDNGGYEGSLKSDIHVGSKLKIKAGDTVNEVTVTAVGDYEHGEFIEFDGSASVGEQGRVEILKQSDISGFKVGDAVTISESKNNNMTFIIDDIKDGAIYAESNIFTTATNDSFVIERKIPDLDYICESDNRIWGCSNSDNTIYASALGDPTNFFDYSGESTDSYAVAVGSPERFTACCRYGGAVLFFKENKIHKVLGSYPAEYTLYSYDVEGVQEGSHKSLQTINEVLYYKGIHGVFAYNGSPRLISANFGDVVLWNAVAGNDGDTYYISMSGIDRCYLFAYETKYGLWVLEDDLRVVDFIKSRSTLRMLAEGGKFFLCDAGESETGIEWHIQFAPFYETIEGKKSYSRIVLRLEIPQGSYMIVDVKTDGGAWREAGKVVGKRDGIIPVNVPINRCDKFEIRLRGKGKCTIHQMKREFFVGGDK